MEKYIYRDSVKTRDKTISLDFVLIDNNGANKIISISFNSREDYEKFTKNVLIQFIKLIKD